MTDVVLTPTQAGELVESALRGRGLSASSARVMAGAAIVAECEGRWAQGIASVFGQIRQIDTQQVDIHAVPTWACESAPSLVMDAGDGFLLPAIEQGLARAASCAQAQGQGWGHCSLRILGHAALCRDGLGHQLERIADQGLIALGFAPVSSGQLPDGAPAALALPRADTPSLVIDLSAGELAHAHLLLAGEQAQPLPPAWALDGEGRATSDAGAALETAGSARGGRMALVVGLLAAALSRSVDISSHRGDSIAAETDARCSGYRFIVIDPARLGATDFDEELDGILALAFMNDDQPMPGSRRREAREHVRAHGISLSTAMADALAQAAARTDASANTG